MDQTESIMKQVTQVLQHHTPQLQRDDLEDFVEGFLSSEEVLIDLTKQYGSPLYVFESKVFTERAEQLQSAFRGVLPDIRVYYAVKSNNHPDVVQTAVHSGLGLDVSSGNELELAIAVGSERNLFSGPGKTDEELALAVKYRSKVTVLIDSFGELERLNRMATLAGATIRAGIRLTSQEHGLWRKFGIPMSELKKFLLRSRSLPNIMINGVQFHTSWNLNPQRQTSFIARLSEYLQKLDDRFRSDIDFLDIGGGFWPPQGEWLQEAGTSEGRIKSAVTQDAIPSNSDHYRLPAVPIEEFAAQISEAVRKHILPHVDCRIYTEPGRWLCNDSMHMLLTVVDKKDDDLVITDGGTNAIGWERFEVDYFPVINLSRPSLDEHDCMVYGSLCTPHDVWGYSYFGDGIERGDILLVPTQGAYTYSLRQRFIKPLPKFVKIKSRTVPNHSSSDD